MRAFELAKCITGHLAITPMSLFSHPDGDTENAKKLRSSFRIAPGAYESD